jgi:hypothetical protein
MSSVNRERTVKRLDSGATKKSQSLLEGRGKRAGGTAVLGFCEKLISLSSFPFFVFVLGLR